MIGPAAGCNYPVTHAQEIGAHEIELALAPVATPVEAIHAAASYVSPLSGEACLATTEAAELARLPRELLAVEPAALAVTCLKRAESGDGAIVRCFNPTGERISARVRYGLPWSRVERVDLAERPTGDAPRVVDREALIEVAPYAVATLRFV
jgi:alpha-mannosidase